MKIQDRIILSAAAGIIAATMANLFLYTLNLFIPGNNINMPRLVLEFFININPNNLDLISMILGYLWSLIVGGTYAFIYVLLLDITGWKHLMIKSISIIHSLWLLGAGTLTRSLNLAKYVRNEPISIGAFFIAHIFFAIVLSFIINLIGGPIES